MSRNEWKRKMTKTCCWPQKQIACCGRKVGSNLWNLPRRTEESKCVPCSGHHQEKSSKDLSNWQVAVMLLLLKTYSLKILMSKVFLLWIGWIDLDWLMIELNDLDWLMIEWIDMDWLICFWFWHLFKTFGSKMNFCLKVFKVPTLMVVTLNLLTNARLHF